MQPPAAEVNRKARTIDYGQRSAAKPRTCLDDKTLDSSCVKPLAGCNAGAPPPMITTSMLLFAIAKFYVLPKSS
jgi:hypothetical protein